jgi:hypothetical protein
MALTAVTCPKKELRMYKLDVEGTSVVQIEEIGSLKRTSSKGGACPTTPNHKLKVHHLHDRISHGTPSYSAIDANLHLDVFFVQKSCSKIGRNRLTSNSRTSASHREDLPLFSDLLAGTAGQKDANEQWTLGRFSTAKKS